MGWKFSWRENRWTLNPGTQIYCKQTVSEAECDPDLRVNHQWGIQRTALACCQLVYLTFFLTGYIFYLEHHETLHMQYLSFALIWHQSFWSFENIMCHGALTVILLHRQRRLQLSVSVNPVWAMWEAESKGINYQRTVKCVSLRRSQGPPASAVTHCCTSLTHSTWMPVKQ